MKRFIKFIGRLIRRFFSALNRISLPAALIIGTVIVTMTLSGITSNERSQQDRQQEFEESLKVLQNKQSVCESLSSGVKDQWNNVMGVTYSEFWEDCVVTYVDQATGEVDEALLKSMQKI